MPPAPRAPRGEGNSLLWRNGVRNLGKLTVGHGRRDSESALLTDTHAEEPLVPTTDDLTNTHW